MKRVIVLLVLLFALTARADAGDLQVITVGNVSEIIELANFSIDPNLNIWDLDFAPNNEYLAIIGASRSPRAGWLEQLHLWDLDSLEQLQTSSYADFSISSVAFSPDGEILIAGGFNGEGYSFEVNTHTLIDNYTLTTQQINDVAFSPNGEFVGFAGASVPASPNVPRVLPDDLQTIRILHSATAESVFSWRPSDEISNWGGGSTIAFSRDGQFLALGQSGNVVSVWNLVNWEQTDLIGGGTGGVNSVLFPAQEDTVIVMYGDGKVVTWNLETQEQIRSFEGRQGWFSQLLMTNDEQLLITTDRNGNIIFLDSETGEEVHSLDVHDGIIVRLALSPDGTLLASGGADGTVRLWGIPAGG